MTNASLPAALVSALALTWACGCAENQQVGRTQSRVLDTSATDEVVSSAADILRREFGRVRVDAAARTVETEPVEYASATDARTARGMVGVESQMRRIGYLSATARGDGTVVQLRIDLERLDTGLRRSAQYQTTRLSDSPGHTAIERDAATTEEQNAVWTRIGRDRTLERAILDELEEQFPGTGPPEPRAVPAPDVVE